MDKNENIKLAYIFKTVDNKNILNKSIKSLLRELNRREKHLGFLNALNSNIKLLSSDIRKGIAYLNFNSNLEYGAAGSILRSRIRQIIYTATQFDNVRGVVIKINGRRRGTLGGDGLSIGGILKRRSI